MKGRKSFLKIISILLVGILVLTGCNSGEKSSGSEGKEEKDRSVSILMVQQDSTAELRDKLIPQFEKETGIDVTVDILPEAGMDTKMILSLSGNTGEYDVVMTGAKSWSQLISSKWIVPLDEFISDADLTEKEYIDGFSSSLMGTLKFDDKTYAMPYQVGSNMLFYNKEMFEKAGLDPNRGPKDLDELLEYAKKLNKPEEGQYGFVTRGTREGNANSFSWIMMWFLNGGRWVDVPGKQDYAVLDGKEAIETTEYFSELTKYAPEGIGSYGFAEAQLAMQQGTAAMWMDAAQLGPSLEDKEKSKVAGKIGYHVMEGVGDDYTVGPVWGFSITNTAKDKEASWELVKFLTNKETSLAQALSGSNGSPARIDVLEDAKIKEVFNPEFAAALIKASSHANPHYSPLIAQGTEIRSSLSVALSSVISGEKKPEQAMKDSNKEVIEILKKAGLYKE